MWADKAFVFAFSENIPAGSTVVVIFAIDHSACSLV